MEKVRQYKYDNLKFILIFLVVFGHLLELTNTNLLYKVIYIFHMPMFIYISGYFSKCTKQSILKKTYIYIVWQVVYYLVYKFALKQQIAFSIIKLPIWILWYIYSLIVWESVIYFSGFIKKKIKFRPIVVILILFILSLISGFINKIGYIFSISRIITFFPYFAIGYYQRNKKPNIMELNSNSKTNKKKIIFYSIIAVISIIYFIFYIKSVSAKALYGAFSYKSMGYNIIYKLMWILLSLSIMFLLVNIVNNKKNKLISEIGSNTLIIYLIHGLIIKIFGNYIMRIFTDNNFLNVVICLLISLIILIILGNKYTKRIFSYFTNIPKIN